MRSVGSLCLALMYMIRGSLQDPTLLCFDVNGAEYPGMVRCSNSGSCCQTAEQCTFGGLCSTSDKQLFYRGPCVHPDWTGCNGLCRYRMLLACRLRDPGLTSTFL